MYSHRSTNNGSPFSAAGETGGEGGIRAFPGAPSKHKKHTHHHTRSGSTNAKLEKLSVNSDSAHSLNVPEAAARPMQRSMSSGGILRTDSPRARVRLSDFNINVSQNDLGAADEGAPPETPTGSSSVRRKSVCFVGAAVEAADAGGSGASGAAQEQPERQQRTGGSSP